MTPATVQPKHILLIDDDAELAELLTEYLACENIQVTSCLDGASGLARAFDDSFDLILLDVMMPVLNGFEVLKALGGKHKTPILMLTAKGDDNDRILGLELGADDYLAKPFKHRELLARINAIFRRISIVKSQSASPRHDSAEQLMVNQVRVNQATREITCQNSLLELTGTEYLVLVYMLEHHGKIISKAEISEQVLQRKLSPYDRTVDVHVGNVRRKLLAIDPIDKMKTVRGAGYVFLQGEQ
ncbi:response regulator transcription factor [Colwellia psychrerythraea]|uniref:Two component transcriptional regulator, winged helix family n=1 Tax=Colwellia psychrerythraea TaxID=28229 RepID=A0A099K8Q4_COLPS|nr:response regulator transcription factor [Colwellia psychrerythraea]KGJ86472.1 two component transcriptional regulator, winged helix family [Colwellia psychrerythraea]